jgi:hypothetical protein
MDYDETYTNNSCVNIVTDLINALLGNNSVNTVQQATLVEAEFSMSSA